MQLKGFKQLNQDQRVEIYSLKAQWLSNRKVAFVIWVHHTTIWRELKRNSIDYWRWVYKYKPIQAQSFYEQRRESANYHHTILVKNHALRSKIHSLLINKGWERWPNEMVNRLKNEWWKTVSTWTIYRFIRNNTKREKYLRYKQYWYKKNKWNKKYEKIKWVEKIDKRSKNIEKRLRIWDWEIDTVLSCRRWKWWLFTATERKSRYEIIKKVWNLKAKTLYVTMLACFNEEKVKTITSDNWSEFCALSQLQTDLKVKCYTAHPYCSCERWTNERHNWFIRWFIPKWSDISKYSENEIAIIQNKLNHKPRKCLDYRTPYEVYHNVNLTYI